MALSSSYTFFGNAGWSLDATDGSSNDGDPILVEVAAGSQVEQAFLYATTFDGTAEAQPDVNLSSGAAALGLDKSEFTELGETSGFDLSAFRADVTDFVSGVVGTGGPTPFEFRVDGVQNDVDGYALAVVFSNPSLPERTIAFLDGFSDQDGDDFRLSFDRPLPDLPPGAEVLMSLGIGFGFQTSSNDRQFSQVDVNGDRLTTSAGGFDDGSQGNGGLVTIGGLGDDPANPADPNARPGAAGSRSDDELYNLAEGGYLEAGDRSILVETLNPSNDDNIFFAGFNLPGDASIVTAGNDAPVAVNDGGAAFTTSREAAFRTGNVLANDRDPDGDPFSLTQVNGAPVGLNNVLNLGSGAQLTPRANGLFDYDPNGAFDGLPDGQVATDTFTYTISDGQASNTATVTVTIQDLTPAPAEVGIFGSEVLEGDSGTTNLAFDLERFGNLGTEIDFEVTVRSVTANSSDVDGKLPMVLTGTFNPSDVTVRVFVPVTGDETPEPDETLEAQITGLSSPDPSAPVNLLPLFGFADGVILDDDTPRPPPPPPVEADIFGDPHLTTLDGLGYDFQAVGEFTLVRATSGPALDVQVRTVPLNDAVSVIEVMATEFGADRVVIDVTRDVPLTINGVPTTIDPLQGPAAAGGGEIYFDAEEGSYTLVTPDGEQIKVGLFDGFMNVCMFLTDTRDPGSVQGLLGNADGDQSNDLALPDGTVLSQPVEFDTLYGQYADAWRIEEAEAHFDRAAGETTADFQDPSYPRVAVTLDDLPAQLVADATAVVDAQGITNPVLREAAIIDIALTGNPDFASSANALAAEPTADSDPSNAPALGATIGIRAAAASAEEGDSGTTPIQFEVYRIGDTSAALDVLLSVGGTIDASDLPTPLPDPSPLADRTISFAASQASRTVTINVAGDEDWEPDETLTASIDVDPAIRDQVSIIASRVSVTVENDDPAISGSQGPETLTGTPAIDRLNGRDGNDVLEGGASGDLLTLGGGADEARGAVDDMDGDVVTDFGEADQIRFTGLQVGRGRFDVADGSAVISVDTDGDGAPDATFTLEGDFSTGDFMTVDDGGDIVMTFEGFLPTLSETAAVDAALINGIVNQAFLNGDNSSSFTVEVTSDATADFDNALGVYEIDGAGDIVDVRMVTPDANAAQGSSFTVSGVDAGNSLGFFLVQDGADFANGLAGTDVLTFIDGAGGTGNVGDDAGDLNLAVNGAASGTTVFHSFAAALNDDGVQHALSGVAPGGAALRVGFEDLTGGGDADYQDVVLTITPDDAFVA